MADITPSSFDASRPKDWPVPKSELSGRMADLAKTVLQRIGLGGRANRGEPEQPSLRLELSKDIGRRAMSRALDDMNLRHQADEASLGQSVFHHEQELDVLRGAEDDRLAKSLLRELDESGVQTEFDYEDFNGVDLKTKDLGMADEQLDAWLRLEMMRLVNESHQKHLIDMISTNRDNPYFPALRHHDEIVVETRRAMGKLALNDSGALEDVDEADRVLSRLKVKDKDAEVSFADLIQDLDECLAYWESQQGDPVLLTDDRIAQIQADLDGHGIDLNNPLQRELFVAKYNEARAGQIQERIADINKAKVELQAVHDSVVNSDGKLHQQIAAITAPKAAEAGKDYALYNLKQIIENMRKAS